MLDDLALFVTIVEAGSLNAAAAKENLPPATVTRRLQKLESQLGYRLLNRSARRLQPTAEGWQYYEQCRPLVHALRQATQQLDASLSAVSGSIRVLAPVDFASGLLTPAWVSFMQQYPDIQLELEVSNRLQDLVVSGADMAIRVGSLDDSSLMQRRLGSASLVMVAAPSYLARAGVPHNLLDLERHELIVAEPLRSWRLRRPGDGAEMVLQPQARLRVNEMRLAVDMAEAGIGILLCPLLQCRHAVADGRLVRVLPEWMPLPRHVYAVWPQRRYLPARVRVLLEHLAAFAAGNPLLRDEDPASLSPQPFQ
ncbi:MULTISPECIES: LysR family transcriptional regulator [unclassified Janthinobacterium]|uniref:LysR family transcriptional regulator n=1 Tax=unclassified Janthinobacterium TaxID=2610881 RepID=UPI0016114965|nr:MULTISPECIES: LysR family transcriptional regulator [unclassified Janthinobacterium]MBB5368306.1 LysR family transcriptional regulator AphB [Janthinobacterium sp. K2C7]MBB5382158.1 LysR family transcriptional regulator AphB [Janthinobacterium sp. K2Li3]MBB5386688.1 LysR family transcriptional regulator AphB [Janthinobacterium sp. K2E3]